MGQNGGMRTLLAAGILPALLLAPGLTAQEGEREGPAPLFDQEADPAVQLRAAVAQAAKKNKRVLVLWGENGSDRSRLLHDALRGRTLSREMLYEYELLLVDGGRHGALAGRLRAALAGGLPAVSVLDGAGKPLAHRPAAELFTTAGADAEGLLAFLEQHEATPLDASKVYAEARVRAAKQKKRVLVRFGAPW